MKPLQGWRHNPRRTACPAGSQSPAVLKLHAIRQVGKHHQLHLRVRGVSSAGQEQMLDIVVDTGAQVSLVRRGGAEFPIPAAQRCAGHPQTGQWRDHRTRTPRGQDQPGVCPPRAPVAPRSGSQTPDQGGVLRRTPARVGHDQGVSTAWTSPTPGSFPTGAPCSSRRPTSSTG